jgi:Asp-tRNA(Asn)/Glu-tRNA(Gln) amidotransferase B subunit
LKREQLVAKLLRKFYQNFSPEGGSPKALVEKKGLIQISDSSAIEKTDRGNYRLPSKRVRKIPGW